MHLGTYSHGAAGRMIAHYERNIGEREHIDPEKPVHNLAPAHAGGAMKRYLGIVSTLEMDAKTRPLADWLVTMPKGLDVEPLIFFGVVYEELLKLVGDENLIGAWVHLDEPGAQPHMHFAFVPVADVPVMTNDKANPLRWTAKDEKKNPEHKAGTVKRDPKGTVRYKRVPLVDENGKEVTRHTAKASAMFTKKDMEEIHPAMERAVCEALGIERAGLTLDEDDAAKVLSSLNHADYERVTAEIKRADAELEQTTGELDRAKVELEQVSESLDQTKGELDVATERLESVRQDEDGEREAIGRIEVEIEQARKDLDAIDRRISQFRSAVSHLKSTLTAMLQGAIDRGRTLLPALTSAVRAVLDRDRPEIEILDMCLGMPTLEMFRATETVTGIEGKAITLELAEHDGNWSARMRLEGFGADSPPSVFYGESAEEAYGKAASYFDALDLDFEFAPPPDVDGQDVPGAPAGASRGAGGDRAKPVMQPAPRVAHAR